MTLTHLSTSSATFLLRRAVRDDVVPLVALIAQDQLRAGGETLDPDGQAPYLAAFELIDSDPANLLIVVEDQAGTVVGTMQLTFIPGLARHGALRMQIEAVRVAESLRGNGLGAGMMRWAIAEAERRGARLIQLTSDNSRTDAHRFYEKLGFVKSHSGFKLAVAGQ